MTERRIQYSLKRIDAAKQKNYQLETLLKIYHLNVSILKYLAVKLEAVDFQEDLKPRQMVEQLLAHIDEHLHLKAFITKKNLKTLKPWLSKMDAFFKTLRIKEPPNTKQLIPESEKILAILKISASKVFVSGK